MLSRPPSRGRTPASPRAMIRQAYRHQYYIALALRLAQNLPPQILLGDPVVLYDALDDYFPIFLEQITCAEVSTRSRFKLLPPVLIDVSTLLSSLRQERIIPSKISTKTTAPPKSGNGSFYCKTWSPNEGST